MLRRIAVVLVSAAVSVPLLSAPASASCTDDLAGTNLTEGYSGPYYSPYWPSGYVQVSGITVTFHGDALVSDGVTHVFDWANWADVVSGNAADATTEFVDCVAG